MQKTDRAIKQAAADIFKSLREHPKLVIALQNATVVARVGGLAVTFMVPAVGDYVGGAVADLFQEAVLAPLALAVVDAAATGLVQTSVATRRKSLVAKLKADAATIAAKLYREPLLRIAQLA